MAGELSRVFRILRSQATRVQNALIIRSSVFAILLASAEHRQKLNAYKVASISARRTLAAEPRNREAWTQLGDALRSLSRPGEAVKCYERALMLAPEDRRLWQKRAIAMQAAGKKVRLPDCVTNPRTAQSWIMRAGAFAAQKRFSEAAEACDKALALEPAHYQAMRMGIRFRIRACDWRKREHDKRLVTNSLREGLVLVAPLTHRRLSDSEAESLVVGRQSAPPPDPAALWKGTPYNHERIRLAYVCAEFREHAISFALAGLFEHHDRKRFELYAISLGRDDGSNMRRRIEASFDQFIDAHDMNDAEVAQLIKNAEVDIAADLSSFIGEGRLGIFSRRPAPIQVNYLAYPGTIGAPYFDYIIGDQTVIPGHNRVHYAEQVVYLPHTYQPTDNRHPVSDNLPSRSAAGLPETGFVFACFNRETKFSPEVFAVWMRILLAVDGSVLWLYSLDRQVAEGLRQEAQSHGVAPERLIFAHPLRRDLHLARIQLADLFLDTLPYNAHATACDALWAGLPLLTCLGDAFPGRVAASGLYAVELPELVTASLAEYEKLAIELAQDTTRLTAIRGKLSRNRFTKPLFDTPRYTRNLESAYITMWERQRNGLPPASFCVSDGVH